MSAATRLGRYEVVGRIGTGGMGTIYQARDPLLDRMVVIKVLSPGARTESDIERLAREAEATARLVHPNIVAVIEFGVDEHGKPYLVREFVEGESLDTILRRGPLTVDDALAVATAVCSALVAAHASGVIHRDIKPSNVLIPRGARFGEAKLSDFGVVGALEGQTGFTRSGEIVGTPYYMSPEQLHGSPQTAAADLYGLGVLLYEMLFGSTPFRGDLQTLVGQILNQPVAFPDLPPTPGPVRTLLAALLAKRPDERPRSAEAVLSTLRALKVRALQDTGVMPAPRSVQASQPVIVARSRFASWPFALGIIVAALGVVLPISVARGPGVAAAVVAGIAIGAGGVVLALLLSRRLNALRPEIADEASRVLLGAERRHLLTQSLAIDVDKLIRQCRRIDQRVLGQTLALAVDQLQHATSSADHLAILPTVVDITTQLSERLTPWYVRYEKLLAFFVALVGLVTGIATALQSLP